jgi:DNA-binding LacI/PurR family transcriptional regulator
MERRTAMITIRDVAEAAGVSTTTVSRALSDTGRIAASTRQRIRRIAEELEFRPNEVARSLGSSRSMTIGLVVPDITNPFFPQLIAGAESAARLGERTIFLVQSADATSAAGDLGQLRAKQVDGIILVGNPFDDAAGLIAAVGDTPVVVVDRGASLPNVVTLSSDHHAGGRIAVEHLVAQGHRTIVHLAGPPELDVTQARTDGYRSAMTAAGLRPRVVTAGFTAREGNRAVRRLLADDPAVTAVTAANDLVAIGAIHGLSDLGLEVPADVSVIGYDDIDLASFVRPALTTIRQPTEELGRTAVRELDAMIAERDRPSSTTPLPVELVIRDSTGRATSAGKGS